MQRAAEAAPDVFQEQMEDLHRFVAAGAAQPDDQDNPTAAALLQGYRET
jgi:hypothetical protein